MLMLQVGQNFNLKFFNITEQFRGCVMSLSRSVNIQAASTPFAVCLSLFGGSSPVIYSDRNNSIRAIR